MREHLWSLLELSETRICALQNLLKNWEGANLERTKKEL